MKLQMSSIKAVSIRSMRTFMRFSMRSESSVVTISQIMQAFCEAETEILPCFFSGYRQIQWDVVLL